MDTIILIAALWFKKRLYTYEPEDAVKKPKKKWYLFWKEESSVNKTLPIKKDVVSEEKKEKKNCKKDVYGYRALCFSYKTFTYLRTDAYLHTYGESLCYYCLSATTTLPSF